MERQSASCGRHLGRVVVVLFLCLVGLGGDGWRWAALTPGGVSGEAVFHLRHHEDQRLLNPTHHTYAVYDEEQALTYLVKYGYLKCIPPSRVKRDIPSELDIITEMPPHQQTTHSMFVTSQTPGKDASASTSPGETLEAEGGGSSTVPASPASSQQDYEASSPPAATSNAATSTVISEMDTVTATSPHQQESVTPTQPGRQSSQPTATDSASRGEDEDEDEEEGEDASRSPEMNSDAASSSQNAARDLQNGGASSSESRDLEDDATLSSGAFIDNDEVENITMSSSISNTFPANDDDTTSVISSPDSDNETSSFSDDGTRPDLASSASDDNVTVFLSTFDATHTEATPSSTAGPETGENTSLTYDVTSNSGEQPVGTTQLLNGTTTPVCTRNRSNTTASPLSIVGENKTDGLSEGEARTELSVCTETEIAEALRHFQRIYLQQESGQIDVATLRSMNQRRCGNSDQELGAKAAQPTTPTQTPPPTSTRTLPKSRRKRRALERIAEAKERRRLEALNAVSTTTSLKRSNALPALEEHDPAREREKKSGLLDRIQKAAGRFTPNSLQRREQQLAELKEEMRNQPMPPKYTPLEEHRIRHKRSTPMMTTTTTTTMRFDKGPGEPVTWRLMPAGYSENIPVADVRSILVLAFRMWSEVIPLTFDERISGDINDVDIEISFVKLEHLACSKKFDGNGGEIAHSWATGNIHFDDDEDFKSTPDGSDISLLLVAIHEIGHVLGLIHTERSYSIMYAVYTYSINESIDFELGWEDRKDVQGIYGPCKGKFDVVFDWIRYSADGHLIFNTYFFRSKLYWMYENRYNRTRYGDPLRTTIGWKGVPEHVDSYAQTFFHYGGLPVIDSFFFKGDKYYAYNNSDDQVLPGYPRLIQEDFGPGDNSTDSIPDNIDAVYYERSVNSLIFFKDEYVFQFGYNMPWSELRGTAGCCEKVQLFSEAFPPWPNDTEILEGYIDAAYFVQVNQRLFFFQGEKVWVRAELDGITRLKYVGKWWNRFYDICEP